MSNDWSIRLGFLARPTVSSRLPKQLLLIIENMDLVDDYQQENIQARLALRKRNREMDVVDNAPMDMDLDATKTTERVDISALSTQELELARNHAQTELEKCLFVDISDLPPSKDPLEDSKVCRNPFLSVKQEKKLSLLKIVCSWITAKDAGGRLDFTAAPSKEYESINASLEAISRSSASDKDDDSEMGLTQPIFNIDAEMPPVSATAPDLCCLLVAQVKASLTFHKTLVPVAQGTRF